MKNDRQARAFDRRARISAASVMFLGCYGFGDNFYQRPLIRHLTTQHREVYVRTCLPEAYWDMPSVKFIHPGLMHLRTQLNHIHRYHLTTYVIPPAGSARLDWAYYPPHHEIMPGGKVAQVNTPHELSNAECIRMKGELPDYDFAFPVKEEWIQAARAIIRELPLAGKKLCLVRPPTLRREWFASARNPKMEYFQLLIDQFGKDYFFLSLADLKPGEEWIDGEPLTGIDREFHHGELPLTTIFGLVKLADMTLCYPGFLMLAAIAERTKCFCLFGGMQKPEILLDRQMGLERFAYVAPDPFCFCMNMTHVCNKELDKEEIVRKFEKLARQPVTIKTITIGVPPGLGDLHWIMTKLESFKKKEGIDVLRIAMHEDRGHAMNAQYLDHLPFVDEVMRWPTPFNFDFALNGGAGNPLTPKRQGVDLMIEFNSALESGKRVEDVLPEYETNWDYPVNPFSDQAREAASGLKAKLGRLDIIYPSSGRANLKWSLDWPLDSWLRLIERIHAHTGKKIVLVGAPWDQDYGNRLLEGDRQKILIDMIGKTDIPQVLEMIRQADTFTAYPSGLAIMAVQYKTPCAMFWPITGISRGGQFQKHFMTSWLPPWAKDSPRYRPFIYGSPETTPDKVYQALRPFLGTERWLAEELTWNDPKGFGFFPVDGRAVYSDAYFDEYERREHTPIGEQINAARADLVNQFLTPRPWILDFGAANGAFLRKRGNALGFDICPKAVDALKSINAFHDPYAGGLDRFGGITFFDSLEHLEKPDAILSRVLGNQFVIVSLPIFQSAQHVLASKHFKPAEHYWYFTWRGFIEFMLERKFALLYAGDDESRLGREDIGTFVFRRWA
jgi:hypothetical protein